MIDKEGRLLCDSCLEAQNTVVMGKLQDRGLVLFGKHHGERHLMTLHLYDILPPSGTQAYADVVAELVKRLPSL